MTLQHYHHHLSLPNTVCPGRRRSRPAVIRKEDEEEEEEEEEKKTEPWMADHLTPRSGAPRAAYLLFELSPAGFKRRREGQESELCSCRLSVSRWPGQLANLPTRVLHCHDSHVAHRAHSVTLKVAMTGDDTGPCVPVCLCVCVFWLANWALLGQYTQLTLKKRRGRGSLQWGVIKQNDTWMI